MCSEEHDGEARLSWVLAALAGMLGATAFTHSAMHPRSPDRQFAARGAGLFRNDAWMSVTVVADSILRRRRGDCVGIAGSIPGVHPLATVLTTFSLMFAAGSTLHAGRLARAALFLCKFCSVVFGIGALNIVRQGWRGISFR